MPWVETGKWTCVLRDVPLATELSRLRPLVLRPRLATSLPFSALLTGNARLIGARAAQLRAPGAIRRMFDGHPSPSRQGTSACRLSSGQWPTGGTPDAQAGQ